MEVAILSTIQPYLMYFHLFLEWSTIIYLFAATESMCPRLTRAYIDVSAEECPTEFRPEVPAVARSLCVVNFSHYAVVARLCASFRY
jgi:hypothetical protein